MHTIRILEASNVHVDDYRNLRLEALREEPHAFGSAYKDHVDVPIDKWQKWLNNFVKAEKSWMIFAAIDNKLVGMLGAFQNGDEVKDTKTQINAMYVSKNARGNGISKLLMQTLLKKLQNLKIKNVTLAVNINQTTAVNLYRNFGFSIQGTENPVLGDGKIHQVYIMQKAL